MDIFLEKIIEKKRTRFDYFYRTAIIVIGAALALILPTIAIIRPFWPALVIIIIFAAYYLSTSRNIEFEYSLTNGDLDIDKIISKRRRTKLFSAPCKDFDIVAKLNSEHFKQEVKGFEKRIEMVGAMTSPNVYFATLNYKGQRTVIFFEPDERMLNAFKTYIPRKLFV